jgi:hypothetical protein
VGPGVHCSVRLLRLALAAASGLATPAVTVPLTSTEVAAGAEGSSVGAPAVCSAPQTEPTFEGHPHLASIPSLKTVLIISQRHGLRVSYTFRTPLVLAPEGVYISWTVYVYRTRADANGVKNLLTLQLEDRGAGWEPTGWAMLVSLYSNESPVLGPVLTDKARDRLTAYFPPGFVDLSPPFYWFASQEEYRAYLPGKDGAREWSVNGGAFNDCPAGVRHDPNSFPYATKLLAGPS